MKRVKDLGSMLQEIFADTAKAIKTVEAGMDYTPKGAVGAAQIRVEKANPIVFYNPTGATIFVAFGNSGMTAPATAADGFPVLAGEKAHLNSGQFAYARASATGLFWYASDNE